MLRLGARQQHIAGIAGSRPAESARERESETEAETEAEAEAIHYNTLQYQSWQAPWPYMR